MVRVAFELADARRQLIHDPQVLIRFVQNDSGAAQAFQTAAAGEPIVLGTQLSPGSLYRVEITPSRFSPALRVLHVVDTLHTVKATLIHRASAWTPAFAPYAALGPGFDPLKARLAASKSFKVGRNTAPVSFVEAEYDGVDPADESRVLAKASLLNMFALLGQEPRPGNAGGRWFDGIGELYVATRERILCAITEKDARLIERIREGAHGERYKKAPAGMHADNFREVPGFAFDAKKLFSVKTKDDFGNLQLTVARGEIGGLPAVVLDADCDENGQAFAHLLDLPRHAVTGGTHPVEIHDILVARDPARDLGYTLEPVRSREETVAARVDVRVRAVREAVTPALAGIRNVAVLGDSVTWGQGLRAEQKMHEVLRAALGGTAPPAVSLAHSGAVIGVGLPPGSPPAAHPEVPRGRPSILEQVAAFPQPEEVDLLIVNGGINDLDIRYILNPLTSVAELTDDTNRVCGHDMERLLAAACARFSKPTARIVVVSYYPILSAASDPLRRLTFLDELGILRPAATEPAAVQLSFWGRLIENCATFYAVSSDATRAAVGRVNATVGAGRVRFAEPPFRAENAALAPQAWLFGLTPLFGPEDPMRNERRVACGLHEPDFFRRLQCERASAGHPNPLGAAEFAAAVVGALTVEVV